MCLLLTSAVDSLSSQTEDSSDIGLDIIVKSGEFPDDVVDSGSFGVFSWNKQNSFSLQIFSLHILVTSFWFFCYFSCVVFCITFARQAGKTKRKIDKLLRNIFITSLPKTIKIKVPQMIWAKHKMLNYRGLVLKYWVAGPHLNFIFAGWINLAFDCVILLWSYDL